MSQLQDDASKKGEIEFRRRLARQHVEGEKVLDDEFDAAEMRRILAERMDRTREVMRGLKARGVALAPYLEIGAERGQRSLVMENEFGPGAAADLSFDMLKSCAHYRGLFGLGKTPLRVCCDAHRLPFLSGSFPFVFCFETLHHFPSPAPLIRELHRVLAPGGAFYFDEEPYKKVLHMHLYRTDKAYAASTRRRGTLRKALDYFFAEQGCNETDYGIIENHDIPVADWIDALRDFDGKDLTLRGANRFTARPAKDPVRTALAKLVGGSISGLCRKAGALSPSRPPERSLACPACLAASKESALSPSNSGYGCAACGVSYPVRDGVLFLLAPAQLKQFYPEVEKG